jgi:hypothetical protein
MSSVVLRISLATALALASRFNGKVTVGTDAKHNAGQTGSRHGDGKPEHHHAAHCLFYTFHSR